jgi:hypothetical protein
MRLATKIVIGVLTPIVGYFGYDSLMGHWLVHRLCAKDGGLRIYETTFVDGYLDESESNPYSCLGCFWKLAKHQFKYVDVHVRGRTPEYFRFSLASKGDPRCEPSRDTFMRYGWSKLEGSTGIASDHCVAVEALPGRPAGPVLTARDYQYDGEFGPPIYVRDVAINDVSSGRELAHLKNYYFVGKWSDLFNFGPSRPTARCEVPLSTYLRITNAELLMDTGNKTSSDSNRESLK